MLKIGKVLSSHGLSGNVKVASFFEDPDDIFRYRLMDGSGKALNCARAGSTSRRDVFLVKFEHINSIEEAKKYNGTDLFVNIEDLPALSEGEIYIESLIGMAVVDGVRRGVVTSLSNYGAGDILEVSWDNGRSECMIYSGDLVETIDKQNRIIKIHPPAYI
ncbi:MAG: ribosome maturation factor RimM [Rickettsiales bacterium]|jgi:16S rRNA processing protein RimM|nr:ribosome maturation factor RimM [Rickettsiales bacterium]